MNIIVIETVLSKQTSKAETKFTEKSQQIFNSKHILNNTITITLNETNHVFRLKAAFQQTDSIKTGKAATFWKVLCFSVSKGLQFSFPPGLSSSLNAKNDKPTTSKFLLSLKLPQGLL